VGVGCMESHPGEHYHQIFQEVFIIRSFKKCCISSAFEGSKDGIVWEDNFEDKDDSDWVESTDNNSVMSDDGKSDE
jgi:hypothetical protein